MLSFKFVQLSLLLLVGITVTKVHPSLNLMIWGGTEVARYDAPGGATIEVRMAPDLDIWHREYDRRLRWCFGPHVACRSEWMIKSFDGNTRVNLYQDRSEAIVIVDDYAMRRLDNSSGDFSWLDVDSAKLVHTRRICDAEMPGAATTSAPPASRYFKDLAYLGAFRFVRAADERKHWIFRFVHHGQGGEMLCRYPSLG